MKDDRNPNRILFIVALSFFVIFFSPISSNCLADSIKLTSQNPTVVGNIGFSYSGAAYDTYYINPPHWKIINYNGYMDFSFTGKQEPFQDDESGI